MSHVIQEYSKLEGPTILMVDEVLPWTGPQEDTDIHDWSNLKPSSQVDLIMAVSPAPTYVTYGQAFQVIPPASQPTIFTQHLVEPYRNFAELDRLLSCLKSHQKDLSCK